MAIFSRNQNIREMRNVNVMGKYLVDSYSCFSDQIKIEKSFSADSLEAGLVFLSFSLELRNTKRHLQCSK